MGDIFQKFGEDMREFQKEQYWREATMGDVFQKFGDGMREFSKNSILAGGKLWGHFSRNLEKVCANFKFKH